MAIFLFSSIGCASVGSISPNRDLGADSHTESSVEEDQSTWSEFAHESTSKIVADHVHFYHWKSLLRFGIGFVPAGIMANTDIDEEFQEWYQERARSDDLDSLVDFINEFGNHFFTMPIFGGLWLLSPFLEETGTARTLSDWGGRSFRAILVGVPPLLTFQRVLGATRPSDPDPDSSWDPFNDENGVSGHSFVGAVPFLTAYRMTDSAWRYAFLAASVLPGWARLDNNSHYLSQIALGWWLANIAVDAVNETEEPSDIQWAPMILPDGFGVSLQIPF